jgi:hypothetical protein
LKHAEKILQANSLECNYNNYEHRTKTHPQTEWHNNTVSSNLNQCKFWKKYGVEVNYHKLSIKDKLLVEQYQIPIKINEEAQVNVLIRTLQIHENSEEEKLPELQQIMGNFFDIIGTWLQRTKLVWKTEQHLYDMQQVKKETKE